MTPDQTLRMFVSIAGQHPSFRMYVDNELADAFRQLAGQSEPFAIYRLQGRVAFLQQMKSQLDYIEKAPAR